MVPTEIFSVEKLGKATREVEEFLMMSPKRIHPYYSFLGIHLVL